MNYSSKYDCIIFDFDGVLIDSVWIKNDAFMEIYESYGNEVVNKIYLFNKLNGGLSRYDKFKYFHNNFLNQSISEDEIISLSLKFTSLVEEKIKLKDLDKSCLNFLECYSQSINFYIASATPKNELRRIVHAKNLEKYFLGVYGSPKPKSDILKHIASFRENKDSKMLMIGDSVHDYKAALNSGIEFLGYLGNTDSNPFSKDIKTFNSFDELVFLID